MVVLLALLMGVFPLMRAYAEHVERSEDSDADKMHRMRRAGFVFGLGWGAGLVLTVAELILLERDLLTHLAEALGRPLTVGLVVVLGLAVIITPALMAALAIRPTVERLQGTGGSPKNVKRRTLRALAILLLPQVLWFAAYFLMLRNHVSPLVLALVLVGYVLFLTTATPLLVMAATPTRDPDADTRRLVDDLFDQEGVSIRGVRVVDTSNRPATNAFFAGLGVGPKYIFLTDRLVDSFTEEETRAILAHEIGHLKKHHVALKLLARQGVFILLLALGGGVMLLTSHHTLPVPVAAVVLLLLIPLLVAGPLLTQGTQGIRLERQADDYAVAAAGAEPLRSALVKLTEQNLIKRRTSRMWNVMTQHPGMEERIERLAELSTEDESVPAERG